MGLFPTYIIKWLFPMAETVGISNLPGFPKLNICNGYEVDDVFFFLPQRDTNGRSRRNIYVIVKIYLQTHF